MTGKSRASEILDVKKRAPYGHALISYEIQALLKQWERSKQSDECTPDFFVIRCVTILEVFTRRQIAELIDHAMPYMQRAGEIARQIKIDFAISADIQGRAVTLGDLVAHSISVNSFEQIISPFQVLLDRKLRISLETTADRWETEVIGMPEKPIVADYDQMASAVARLFEIRHILCHELPSESVYQVSEISFLLGETYCLVRSLEEILQFEKFGAVPLTQSAMNAAAADKLRELDETLNLLVSEIRNAIKRGEVDSNDITEASNNSWEKSFDNAQAAWKLFRDSHCDFASHLNSGGSIRPLLWANEAASHTTSRIENLQAWKVWNIAKEQSI